MKLFFYALLAFCIPFCGIAQRLETFQKKFGGIDSEFIWRISATPNGEFVGAGQRTISGQPTDGLFAHFDQAGNILNSWLLNADGIVQFREIISLPNGDFLIAGYSQPYSSSTEDAVDNAFLYRVSNRGTIEWSRQFGNEDTDVLCFNMKLDAQGNILLVGSLDERLDNKPVGVFIKMSPNGSVLFWKSWDTNGDFDRFDNIVEVNDGYIVSGYTDFATTTSPVLPILVKYDFNGNLIWSNAYDDGSWLVSNDFPIISNENNEVYACYNGTLGFKRLFYRSY